MFKIDLSKALAHPALAALVSILPGTFLLISLTLGNPELANCILERTLHYLPLKPYVLLAIALFSAFIIGSAAMLFVGLMQLAFQYAHRIRLAFRHELARWPALPLLRYAGRWKWLARRHFYFRLWLHTSQTAADPESGQRHLYRAWDKLAAKLLKTRYGIELYRVEEEWQFLFWSVGTPTDIEWRGPLLLVALEASGWCGLVATTLAPALLNKYYLAVCTIFLVQGLISDYYAAGRRIDPAGVGFTRIRALLREYEKDAQRQKASEAPKQEPEPE